MMAPGNQLPFVDGRSVFRVLVTLAGLIGLVILIGALLYWLLSDRFTDLDETPWPLVLGSFVQTLVIVLAVDFGWRRRKSLSWTDTGFRPVSIKVLWPFAVGGIVLAGSIEFLERQLGIKPGDLIPDMIAPQGFHWSHFLAVLLAVGVMAPLAEELIFRGVLYSWFRSRLNMGLAIGLNALVFGLVHPGYPLPLMALVALMGAIFAWSYEKTGSLWVPSVLHMAQNSAVVTAVYITLYQSP
jgi:uncharacterized protein